MSDGTRIRVADGEPGGVTPREWATWLARGAATTLPDGRACLVTRDAIGDTILVPVRVVKDRHTPTWMNP